MMFNRGEKYHEFQMWNLGYSTSWMKNRDDGVLESKLYKLGYDTCALFALGEFSSKVYSRNCTACFQFVREE